MPFPNTTEYIGILLSPRNIHRNSTVPMPLWQHKSSCSASIMINNTFDSPTSSAIPNRGTPVLVLEPLLLTETENNNFWEWIDNFLDPPHFSSWLFKQSSRLITSKTSPVQHFVGWRADPSVHCRNTSKFSVCYWWCELEKSVSELMYRWVQLAICFSVVLL